MEPLIRGDGLRMAFGGSDVVKGVDIQLMPGEVHAVVGENGAGKSTVAKLLAGVHQPTGGRIQLGDEQVQFANPRQALDKGVALIHQEPLTFRNLTVAENIFVGHQPVRAGRIDWKFMRRRAQQLLAELGAQFSASALAGGLSIADQQTIELASALAHDARVLLMDETTAALTPTEVAKLFKIIRRLRTEGRAIAFVSHRLDEIFEISDRITVMRDGEKVGELRTEDTTPAEIVRLMVGRHIDLSARYTGAVSTADPVLEVRGLSRKGEFQDIDITVRPGEIVALAGLVGAGRTQVCEAIFGVATPDTGTVVVSAKSVRLRSPSEAMAHGLAMVPEDRQHHGLLLPSSISDNANLPTLRGWWLRRRQEKEVAQEATGRLQTRLRSVDQPVGELSGGNQQKVVLAKWLLTKPKIIILDEPTRGVDLGAKEEVHRHIRELAEGGAAILMVSSDLTEVLALSHRILVMREGRLVAEIAGAEATPEKVLAAATGVYAQA